MNRIIGSVAIGILGLAPLWGGVISTGPPAAERLSADSAMVGHVVLIQGRNLAGGDLVVRFGRARANGLNPGRSREAIWVEVPNKIDPRDPDTVAVTVFVNGQEAEYPNGALQFAYDLPAPLPAVLDYATGNPEMPKSVIVGAGFKVAFTGMHFTTGRRVPVTCLAVGPETESATGIFGTPTDTEVEFLFDGLNYTGDYKLLIGFSDGSAVGIDAPGLAYSLFDGAPMIEAVETLSEAATVSCDFTREMEFAACAFTGLTDIHALSPGIFLEGSFTAVRMSAVITDPDSSPAQSDILLATASYMKTDPYGPPTEVSLLLLDDGSSNTFPFKQQASLLEDCSEAFPDACVCSGATYRLSSGDESSADDRYTRALAFVNPATHVLLQDCLMRERHESALLMAPGDSIGFKFEAVDREGNLTSWPTQPVVSAGTDTLTCTGDPCGCCLMLSSDPTAPPPIGCSGLEGMLSSALPIGLCRSF
jgi:hypothetical protein